MGLVFISFTSVLFFFGGFFGRFFVEYGESTIG